METITYNELLSQTVDGIYNLLEYTNYPKQKEEIKSVIEKKMGECLENFIFFNNSRFTIWDDCVKVLFYIKEEGQIQVFKYLNYEKTMIIEDVVLDCITSSYREKKELNYRRINHDNWISTIAYRNMLLDEHAFFKIKKVSISGHTLFNIDPDKLTKEIIKPFFNEARCEQEILNFFKPQYFGKVAAMLEVIHGKKLVDDFGRYLEEPVFGSEYYRISLADNVYTVPSFQGTFLEMKLLENGNMFDTKENALKYIAYKKAERRLIKRMTELNAMLFIPHDVIEQKYSIDYNQYRRKFEFFYFSGAYPHNLVFKSEKLAQMFIGEMEDDLRIYFRF